ncbi:recombinase RecT [Mesorhizobium sp. M0050]|uniref:recombinase RecT n=1 Tax=Mesorhizobium sp. M0050 TaxID=2956861 RepID=UPI00333CB2C1
MNAVAKVEAKPSLIAMMAAQRNMDPEQFAKTVRATVMPANHTNEQFAALMLVASKYDLDPILKEIYAFPAKGGGIVPIVSIDGWLNLMNSHPSFDGLETEFTDDDQGNPISCTCRIYRKDRSKPIIVTEYLAECIRQTEPWKMKRRMLRHKAVIQCNRYAFGFSGIYDEDEGEKIAEMRDVTPMARPVPPKPPVPPSARQTSGPAEILENASGGTTEAIAEADADTADVIDDEIPEFDRETGEVVEGETEAVESEAEELTPSDMLTLLDDAMGTKTTETDILGLWNEHDLPARLAHVEKGEEFVAISMGIRNKHLKRVRAK